MTPIRARGWAAAVFLIALLGVSFAQSAHSQRRGGPWHGFHAYGHGHRGGFARRFSAHRAQRIRQLQSMSHRTYPRYPWRRRPSGSMQAGAPGDGGLRNWPRRHPGPIWWPRRPLPPVIALGGATPVTIVGFGGNRPPIAPVFSRASGQQPSAAAAALLNNKRHRARELLVEVPNGSADELKQTLSAQYGAVVRELGVIGLINARIWHLTLVRGQNLETVLQQLLQDSRVIGAQPNYVYTPVQGVSPGGSAEPGRVALPPAQPAGELPTGAGVKVAVIDTCVEREHPELQGSVKAFFDATPSASQSCDAANHGTAVASLIGGHDQIQGSAAGSAIISARAFAVTDEEKEIAATSREVALGLDWAAKQNARVANLSFAGPSDPLIEREVAAAYTQGMVLVGAAGNAGPSSGPLYPAAYPEVIAVTATDARRELYNAANRGSHIAVSARGVDVIVAHVNDSYGTESGTSFAAATVSGVAAALLEMRPKATPGEIRAALQNTAVSIAGKGRSELFGYELVNAKAATAFVVSTVSQ